MASSCQLICTPTENPCPIPTGSLHAGDDISSALLSRLLPFDCAGGFGGDVVDHAVDAAHLVDDAGGGAPQDLVRERVAVRGHAVGLRPRGARARVGPVSSAGTIHCAAITVRSLKVSSSISSRLAAAIAGRSAQKRAYSVAMARPPGISGSWASSRSQLAMSSIRRSILPP